jgi:hypothetical protein
VPIEAARASADSASMIAIFARSRRRLSMFIGYRAVHEPWRFADGLTRRAAGTREPPALAAGIRSFGVAIRSSNHSKAAATRRAACASNWR